MLKKRLTTLSITFVLFLVYVLIGDLYIYNYVDRYPRFARTMLVITMIYVMGGCMLQSFGHIKLAKILGIISFILLLACVFYSVKPYEFVIFAVCIYLVLTRAAKVCDCACQDDSTQKQ